MNKPNKNRHVDSKNRVVVTRGEGMGSGVGGRECGKWDQLYGDRRKINFWWWARRRVYVSWNTTLYTWNLYNVINQCDLKKNHFKNKKHTFLEQIWTQHSVSVGWFFKKWKKMSGVQTLSLRWPANAVFRSPTVHRGHGTLVTEAEFWIQATWATISASLHTCWVALGKLLHLSVPLYSGAYRSTCLRLES